MRLLRIWLWPPPEFRAQIGFFGGVIRLAMLGMLVAGAIDVIKFYF